MANDITTRRKAMKDEYKKFIENCTTTPKSVGNYSDFKRIDECLCIVTGIGDFSILDITEPKDLEDKEALLNKNELYKKYKEKGNSQYPNAISTYMKFLIARKYAQMKKNEKQTENISSVFKPQSFINSYSQTIFYGAPGTGKSHTIKQLENDDKNPLTCIRTTFHPDSDYSTFVGCYKPHRDKKTNNLTYTFVPQAFLEAYKKAWMNPEKRIALVIEEINRGNCAQIFGDIFQLLDRDDDGWSTYPIQADTDIADYLEEQDVPAYSETLVQKYGIEKEGFAFLALPPNLSILATMNTSDQSLFPIDSAFKRRWDWKYVPICDAKKQWQINIGNEYYDWWEFIDRINIEIGNLTKSEDKKLGYFFCKAKDEIISAETFVGKVLFYLWNDVFKDYEMEDSVFNIKGNDKMAFELFYQTKEGKTIIDIENVKLLFNKLKIEGMMKSPSDVNGEDGGEPNSDGKWSVIQQKRYDYWDAFLKYANNDPEFAQYFGSRKTPSHDKWYNFSIGKSDCHISIEQTRTRNEMAIELYFDQTTDNFHKLLSYKDSIEEELDMHFEWREMPDKKASNIIEVTPNIDFENQSLWEKQFDFFIDRMLRMRTTFIKYLDM